MTAGRVRKAAYTTGEWDDGEDPVGLALADLLDAHADVLARAEAHGITDRAATTYAAIRLADIILGDHT